jgi:uncharacterized FAD-dependent dehydrogenase
MIKEIDIKITPDKISDINYQEKLVRSKWKSDEHINNIELRTRSIDARGKKPLYFLRFLVHSGKDFPDKNRKIIFQLLEHGTPECIVIGAGPAGYFAALELIRQGIRPVILERGKDVRTRRRDLRAIQQFGEVNPHSNYCFGEGGAGTYSDGKLYTRSHKRGKIKDILQILVDHGAEPDILIDSHPHIGSNKLPKIVSNLRHTIETSGGKVLFDHFVTDIFIEKGYIKGVEVNHEKKLTCDNVILATGHSARDIYHLLDDNNIHIEAKPFALGLRIEHRQSFIDAAQYNMEDRGEDLPAAAYSVTCQVDDNGVFSFCMCPGGLVVPASTAPGEIVVNGMSLSRRDSPYANSGFVTTISLEELALNGYRGKFATLNFQEDVEKKLFKYGDGSQKAPAQRVKDFVEGKLSPELNPTSYIPGLYSAPLHELLPPFVADRLREGIRIINKKMKGYLSNHANVIAVESRTSAPIRIPRDKETYMHPEVQGLFPCGEGAGYAGGILSAAMDGVNVAKAVKKNNQYMRIILLCFTVLTLLSCKENENRQMGPVAEVVSQSGDYFQNSPFLPAPLTHGILVNEAQDTLNIMVLSVHTDITMIEIIPLGAFKILEDTLATQYILSYPYDTSYTSMPRMSYTDFVVKYNAAKVLIDNYFSNYKGLGKTRVIDWQNTHMAQKILDDFYVNEK